MTTPTDSKQPRKEVKTPKQSRAKSLEEKLAALEAQAKAVREKLRDEQRKEREENAKAVVALIKSEDLEGFGIEAWKSALPEIKAALSKQTA
jgi:phage protein D